MPRPEYKDPSKKTIYAEIEPKIKDHLEDICYALDKSIKDALPVIITYFYEHKKIKPRPSRGGK